MYKKGERFGRGIGAVVQMAAALQVRRSVANAAKRILIITCCGLKRKLKLHLERLCFLGPTI